MKTTEKATTTKKAEPTTKKTTTTKKVEPTTKKTTTTEKIEPTTVKTTTTEKVKPTTKKTTTTEKVEVTTTTKEAVKTTSKATTTKAETTKPTTTELQSTTHSENICLHYDDETESTQILELDEVIYPDEGDSCKYYKCHEDGLVVLHNKRLACEKQKRPKCDNGFEPVLYLDEDCNCQWECQCYCSLGGDSQFHTSGEP